MEPLSIVVETADEAIRLLKQAAAEADALDLQVMQLRQENAQLRSQLDKKAAHQPALDPSLLLKVAKVMEAERLLAPGADVDKVAAMLGEKPERLADLFLRVLVPASSEGAPVKAAALTIPGEPKVIEYEGQAVVDHDGWLSCLA